MIRYTIARTAANGRTFARQGLSLREAGQMVAYCATDNLGLTRKEATAHGKSAERAFKSGEEYTLGTYTFTAIREA